MLVLLIFTAFIYIGMIIVTKHRTSIAFVGSGLLLSVGSLYSMFDVGAVFSRFPGEIIILIIALSLFTDCFDKLSLIDYIGYKFISLSKNNKIVIITTLPFLIYLTSMFMNNLTVVLLFAYMALYIALEFCLQTVPILVGIIIGSNIGGAALPWADTPAVILTLYTDFNLLDFMGKLFLPCLFFALLLSAYSFVWYKYFSPKERDMPFNTKPSVDFKRAVPVLIIFIVYVVLVSVAPFINLSIVYISLLFSGVLLLIDSRNPMDVLNELPILDSISFIITLFLIGGVLEAGGILKMAAEYIIGFTGQNTYLITLATLFIAFIISTFLSAGPAAATGGPVLFSQTNRFIRTHSLNEEDKKHISKIYSLKSYLAFSVTFSMLMLFLSAVYLVMYILLI